MPLSNKKRSVTSSLISERDLANLFDVRDATINRELRALLAKLGERPDRISHQALLPTVKRYINAGSLQISDYSAFNPRVSDPYRTLQLLNSNEPHIGSFNENRWLGAATAITALDMREAVVGESTTQESSDTGKQKEICIASSLIVACKHESRTYKLSLSESNNTQRVLSVVSGRDNDKSIDTVTAEVIMEQPICGKHSDNPFTISPTPKTKTISGSKVEFQVQCEKWRNAPFSHVWLPKLNPRVYTLRPSVCKSFNPSAAQIRVFPEIKWEWDVGLNLGGAASEKLEYNASYDKKERKLKQRRWAISGQVDCTYDGEKHQLKGEFEKYTESTLETINELRNVFETVLPKLKNDFTREFSVTWPNLHLKYTSSFEEQAADFNVDHIYDLTFGAAPIIGVKYEADILEVLLGLAKANPSTKVLADILFSVKSSLRSGVGNEDDAFYLKADVAILASIGADVNGEVSINGRNDKCEEGKGKFELNVPLKVEGQAFVEGAVFYTKFKKGYIVGARSGFGGSVVLGADSKGIYSASGFFFTGIYLYYAKYTDAKRTLKSADKWKGESQSNEPKGALESREELEWIAPWPSKEEVEGRKKYFTK